MQPHRRPLYLSFTVWQPLRALNMRDRGGLDGKTIHLPVKMLAYSRHR